MSSVEIEACSAVTVKASVSARKTNRDTVAAPTIRILMVVVLKLSLRACRARW
jgi:hypothetical protein